MNVPRDEGKPRALSSQHRAILEQGSAIAPEVIAQRGYWTAEHWKDLDGLGFRGTQKRPECFPALVVPQYAPDGEYTYSAIRYDVPPVDRNGRPKKYLNPQGVGLRLDVPRSCLSGLRDVSLSLWLCEGAKKADALATLRLVALNTPGVDGWRSPSAIPDLYGIPFKDRNVIVAYDSDVLTKPAVRAAVLALSRWLGQKGARAEVVDWSRLLCGDGPSKIGVDDFLAGGSSLADLEALRLPFAEWQAATRAVESAVPYRQTAAGIVWQKPTREGPIAVPLCNFAARIASDEIHDDGDEVRRAFRIQAVLGGRGFDFTLPAERFASMAWPAEQLGAGAYLFPGQSVREHARVAIQQLSGEVRDVHVYAHTGWRNIDGAWAYLHAGGAIGASGVLEDVNVALPASLERLSLPVPPTGDARLQSVRASIRFLDSAPDRVTVPLFAAVYRAALGLADFSLALVGPTGAGKSELAALAQQHYGSGLDARHLPGNWSSTANALEGLAFAGKDALLVVDDFAPGGSPVDIQRLNREADRLLRNQGNAAARLRMRADTTLRPAKPSRALLLSTGEDLPYGQSLRARLLALELGPAGLNWEQLDSCQRDAGSGLYASALAAFVQWVAADYADVQAELGKLTLELRHGPASRLGTGGRPRLSPSLPRACTCS